MLSACAAVQYARSREALDYLASERDARGRAIQVIKVPLPPPQYYTEVRLARQAVRPACIAINMTVRHGPLSDPVVGRW